MQATILDLRYKMKDVLSALDRRESVHILYHGKEKGIIFPSNKKTAKVANHPFCGSVPNSRKSVESVMEGLRGGRYRDI